MAGNLQVMDQLMADKHWITHFSDDPEDLGIVGTDLETREAPLGTATFAHREEGSYRTVILTTEEELEHARRLWDAQQKYIQKQE